MNSKEKLYADWVKRATQLTLELGKEICHDNTFNAACVQAPVQFKQTDIMFLAFNPAEGGGYYADAKQIAERFMNGNDNPPETWGAKWKWIFQPENAGNSFAKAGWGDAVKQGNYNFFNLFFFGSARASKDVKGNKDIARTHAVRRCADMVQEAIQILKPKCVICLSVPMVFRNLRLTDVHQEEVVRPDGTAYKGLWTGRDGDTTYYGINHISAPNWSKLNFDATIKHIADKQK